MITERYRKTFEHTITSYDEYEIVGTLDGVDHLVSLKSWYRLGDRTIFTDNDAFVIYCCNTGEIKCKVYNPWYIGAKVYVTAEWIVELEDDREKVAD